MIIPFINDFDKRKITDYLRYDIKSIENFKESFEYLRTKLPKNDLQDLSICKWHETKNYDYCLIEVDDLTFIIRQFRKHFTLFIKQSVNHKIRDFDYDKSSYHIVTFFVNEEIEGYVERYDVIDHYKELNDTLPKIIELGKERNKLWLIDNSAAIPVPNYVKIETALHGEEIYNINTYIFALEELFGLHFQFFCETEMIEKIKEFNVGDKFKYGVITKVAIDLEMHGDDPYYHSVGLEVTTDGKVEFKDIYTLASYYYDDVFGQPEITKRRKFIINYNNEKYGISYQKGWWAIYHEHIINDKTIYASTDDIEIVKELLKVDFLDVDIVEIEQTKTIKRK